MGGGIRRAILSQTLPRVPRRRFSPGLPDLACGGRGGVENATVLLFLGPDDARSLGAVAAALRPLARSVDTLAEVEWRSAAADAYRRSVEDVAEELRALAGLLESEVQSAT